MSDATRQDMIARFHEAYENLKRTLKKMPKEAWDFRPGENEWTVHEIIVHLADAEAQGYIRLRTLLAEPGATVRGYDQNAWAQSLNYAATDADDSLKLFKVLRKANYRLLKSLPENIDEHKIIHSERGEWNIDSWLESYVTHVEKHIEQIKRNLDRMTKRPVLN